MNSIFALLIAFATCFIIQQGTMEDDVFSMKFKPATIAGEITDMRLEEVSGMVASRANPGLLWVINDSGNDASLFLIDGQGTVKMKYIIGGMTNFDWEDMAIYTDPSIGHSSLFLADIGDNLALRPYINVIELPEPKFITNKDSIIYNVKNHVFKYADGARDAESLLIDPNTGEMFIISKREKNVRIYLAPDYQTTTDTLLLAYKQSMPYHNINAADISDDGTEILLKNYDAIFYWKKGSSDPLLEALSQKPERLIYTPEPQGESIAWSIDKKGFYTLSERNIPKDQLLYYYKRNKELHE